MSSPQTPRDAPRTTAPAQRCSFCGKPRAEVRSLILGPDLSICNECVETGGQIVLADTAERAPPDAACSFCGKPRWQVEVLVPGPGIYICDACVQLCSEVLAEAGGAGVAELQIALPVARVRSTWWKRWFGRG